MSEMDLDFLNLNDIADAPPALPTNDYNARIIEAEVKDARAGSKYISYAAVVTDGEFAGRRVYGIWSLKPENLWRMKRDFNRLGYHPAGGIPKVADLRGLEGVMSVTANPKNDEDGEATGEVENRIRGWKAAS